MTPEGGSEILKREAEDHGTNLWDSDGRHADHGADRL